MKNFRFSLFNLLIPILLVGCTTLSLTDVSAPSTDYSDLGLTDAQVDTLLSLKQVDEFPLYTMHFYAPYETVSTDSGYQSANVPIYDANWGCSLFAAFSDSENMLFGRNFDWEYSPAVLLYTDPTDGYASVSMVDIKYLGFGTEEKAQGIINADLRDRIPLLDAPYLPFDGFNETGLAVGIAAVPSGNMAADPNKQTIDSLGVIREILDHASSIDEAAVIIEKYNINYGGGPPLHYLVADSTGRAALVEFYQAEMHIIYTDESWHQATNFLRSSAGESARGRCWRYDIISEQLSEYSGDITPNDAMALLEKVSQVNTQWSIVYGMRSGEIHVAMGQKYDDVNILYLDIIDE